MIINEVLWKLKKVADSLCYEAYFTPIVLSTRRGRRQPPAAAPATTTSRRQPQQATRSLGCLGSGRYGRIVRRNFATLLLCVRGEECGTCTVEIEKQHKAVK